MPLLERSPLIRDVLKENDTQAVNNSTTLVNDDQLFLKLKPNTKYIINGMLGIETGAIPDFKFTFESITGTVIDIFGGSFTANAAGNFGDEIITLSSGSDLVQRVMAMVQTGTTSGDLQLQWAQNTANASNTKVLTGSYLTVIEIK